MLKKDNYYPQELIPLHVFTKLGELDSGYFYACAFEAQNIPKRCQVIAKFQQIFDTLLNEFADLTMVLGVSA